VHFVLEAEMRRFSVGGKAKEMMKIAVPLFQWGN